jgi:hypothetical protein
VLAFGYKVAVSDVQKRKIDNYYAKAAAVADK